ncbi:hypothetical protein [Candidatus Nitrospira bockiana]
MFTNPVFWFALLVIGAVLLFVGKKANLLNNTAYAVIVSILIVVAYFHLVDHYLMDMQGLDYWYLFRK